MAQQHGTTPSERASSSTDRVFLSPRVIDQGAFDDCARQLRAMLEAAVARTSELKATLAEANAAQQTVREQQARQKSQLELITRVLKAVSAKSEQVNKALERIEGKATSASLGKSADMNVILERGESMRTEIELSIKRLTMLRDDARSAARELALTLGNVLEAMEEIPDVSIRVRPTEPARHDGHSPVSPGMPMS